jgi:oxygen-dependent protoporphyrinogen oxidase
VQLFEASNRVGGVLETIHDGPYLIERSADNFATLIPDAWNLSKELGIDAQLIRPQTLDRRAFVLNRGRLHPIPAGFSLMQPTRLGSILLTPTLSWPAKLRLLGEYWIPARGDDTDESLQSFAVRRLGREAYENLVEPIVSGIFTADPATLSMRATMPQFLEMEREAGGLIRGYFASRKKDAAAAARRASGARYDQFVAPRDGMSSWIAALVDHLPADCLKLNSPVERLLPPNAEPNSQWTIETSSERLSFDAVVCAAPAKVARNLLQPIVPAAASILGEIQYASSAVVAMVVNRADVKGRTDGFGLIVPRKEGRETLAISYTSNKYPGRVPDGEILLRIFLGGALNAGMIEKTDSQLLELATGELESILGWQGSQANWQAVIRWKEAMPQYLVGHNERLQQLNQHLSKYGSLHLCGAAYQGVGIPQCVRGARQAANRLLNPDVA